MVTHVEVRVRRKLVVAAIAGACLAVMSAGCSGAASSTAPPASSTAPRATASSPAATTGVVTAPAPAFVTPAVARVDTRIKVYGDCTTPSIEPTEIVLACADYGVLVEGLRWIRWTAAGAMAVGTLVYNDCTPNCAEGHYHHVPGTRVILTVPVPVHLPGGQAVWSQIQEYPEPPGYKTGPFHGGPQPLPIRPI